MIKNEYYKFMNLIEETNRQFQELTKVFMNCKYHLNIKAFFHYPTLMTMSNK